MSTKHTKEGIARNEHLYKSYKNYQTSLQKDLENVQDIIVEAIKTNGINEATMELLAAAFRGYEYIKPFAETSWERYENHCIDFDYDIKD